MTDNVQLKPCPFCGHEAVIWVRGNEFTKKRSAHIKCTKCHVSMVVGAIRLSQEWCCEQVTNHWNTRTEQP